MGDGFSLLTLASHDDAIDRFVPIDAEKLAQLIPLTFAPPGRRMTAPEEVDQGFDLNLVRTDRARGTHPADHVKIGCSAPLREERAQAFVQ